MLTKQDKIRQVKYALPRSRIGSRAMVCVVALAVSEMRPLREQMERRRVLHASDTPRAVKHELGQYFTPGHIADFMASLFPKERRKSIRILDPGAGIGILSCALAERIDEERWEFDDIGIDADEIDGTLVAQLRSNIEAALSSSSGKANVVLGDFLSAIADATKKGVPPRYTHVIMNPPYRKIRAESKERESVRAFGLETVNLYAAFMGAAIAATVDGGHVVAIVPRSFCNGTYYRSFRDFILDRCVIERIHLFGSRDTAFKDESVLQENVIVALRRGGTQGEVVVSHSADGSLNDMKTMTVPFDEIVSRSDPERYINIPSCDGTSDASYLATFKGTLKEIGLQVSTGAVVDFRTKEYLCKEPEPTAVPLLYSVHFKTNRICWPVDSKKPNALRLSGETEKMTLNKRIKNMSCRKKGRSQREKELLKQQKVE